MTSTRTSANDVIRDLGDGLVLRRATPDDAEALIDLNARVHSDDGWDQPNTSTGAWARDLLTRPHPTCQAGDFSLVQDTRSGAIVSNMVLIPQTWSYAGIEFGVGTPELVSTHPDYRRRGLMRAQFDVVHRWSAARGHVLQAISGIPWYYRMFGYEYGLEHIAGRVGYEANVPRLKGAQEPYVVRPARPSDLKFIARLYEQGRQRNLVACARDEAMWRYELDGRAGGSIAALKLCVIETPEGAPAGFLAHYAGLWEREVLSVLAYELELGLSWLAVTPSVLRYIQSAGEALEREDEKNDFRVSAFLLGSQHPLYDVAPHWLPRVENQYAWYVRVPDVPAFLRLISPALEKRLAQSALAGHTGELKISFYRDGLRLVFESGRMVEVQAWQPQGEEEGMACFPNLSFLQLLFGYRSFDELDYAFADCFAKAETRPLLNALFPKQASNVWPIL
jgi:GNAT superfamily N-acetyltransferase